MVLRVTACFGRSVWYPLMVVYHSGIKTAYGRAICVNNSVRIQRSFWRDADWFHPFLTAMQNAPVQISEWTVRATEAGMLVVVDRKTESKSGCHRVILRGTSEDLTGALFQIRHIIRAPIADRQSLERFVDRYFSGMPRCIFYVSAGPEFAIVFDRVATDLPQAAQLSFDATWLASDEARDIVLTVGGLELWPCDVFLPDGSEEPAYEWESAYPHTIGGVTLVARRWYRWYDATGDVALAALPAQELGKERAQIGDGWWFIRAQQ